MKPISFPLNRGMQGAAVGDLQTALRLMLDFGALQLEDVDQRVALLAALGRERAGQHYGQTTLALVRLVQQGRHPRPSGTVDQATAAMINEFLGQQGVLPDLETRLFIVRGRVLDHLGAGISGKRVLAMDQKVGGPDPLNETRSGPHGAYEIVYAVGGSERTRKGVDLQVRVVDEEERMLAASPIRYHARPEEYGLDVAVPGERLQRPAEFAHLLDDLAERLGAGSQTELRERLAGLEEDEQRQDISYLANQSGWDARLVAMSSLAHQFGARTEIEPAFFYALFRAGVPAHEDAFTQAPPETVRRIWEQSLERGILPANLSADIDPNLERLAAFNADRLLRMSPPIGVSNLRELLADVLNDEEDQLRFARLYHEHMSDDAGFWAAVRDAFPRLAERLEMDGKLAFLTLNNADLIRRIRSANPNAATPADLIGRGLYRVEAWQELLTEEVNIPEEIPGEDVAEKRANYAEYMASRLRLSHPTAVVSEMVRAEEMPLRANGRVRASVADFLRERQGDFELGMHPVEGYLRKRGLNLERPVLDQVKTLQRVYQISPSDEVMARLLGLGLESAYAVVRHGEAAFLKAFHGSEPTDPNPRRALGAAAEPDVLAKQTYAKAHQVHHAVVNLSAGYLLERSAPELYALDRRRRARPGNESGVLAYPTLESMFGEMESGACEHARSWLSPSAYLVDLLEFLDPPVNEKENPLQVVLSRRPDIQHVQLTHENTHTTLPYLDLVNEILEHHVVNGSLESFAGFNIEEGATAEELLAQPLFVNQRAYERLRGALFPPPLPFHRTLEETRRLLDHFQISLADAMEGLRSSDALERAGGVDEPAYGWRDILMERLRISREEHALLTESAIPLQSVYGENPERVSVAALVDKLAHAKTLARELGLDHMELVELIRTRFINPHAHLIPKLRRLGLDFRAIQDAASGSLNEQNLADLLPLEAIDTTPFGGNGGQNIREKAAQILFWIRENHERIMNLIVLVESGAGDNPGGFDQLELRYADPDAGAARLRPIEFLKLARFVRIWRKLGWSLVHTERAVAALYPAGRQPLPGDSPVRAADKFDEGFRVLIMRLAHLQRAMELLGLKPKRDLEALLACWSPIDTFGEASLYHRMFLNPSVRPLDPVFEEDGFGHFPRSSDSPLVAHRDALRAAFNLAPEELDLLLDELAIDSRSPLDLESISALFRHAFLARALRMGVRELLALKHFSGLDPFEPLDLNPEPGTEARLGDARPAAIRFLEVASLVKASPLKWNQWFFFMQHVDGSGKASPTAESAQAFAMSLRADLKRIEREHSAPRDPSDEVAKGRMALLYGGDAADTFFGLIQRTAAFTVEYDHDEAVLSSELSAGGRLTYDDFQKTLSFQGVMTIEEKERLEIAAGASPSLLSGVQALFDEGRRAFQAFFDRYPELRALHDDFVNSDDEARQKLAALLDAFLPALRLSLQRQHLHQTLGALVDAEDDLVRALLSDDSLLQAVGTAGLPAETDLLALAGSGLSAEFFWGRDLEVAPDQMGLVERLDYREGGAALPLNPEDGDAGISGIWRAFLDAPQSGFYNFHIQADEGAEIGLQLNGKAVALALEDGVWRNAQAVELHAGSAHQLRLSALGVRTRLILQWERKGMGRTTIPSKRLLPATAMAHFQKTYAKLLKAFALADALGLTPPELTHFAAHPDYAAEGRSWLNALPVTSGGDPGSARALFDAVLDLVRYGELKAAMKIRDARLVEALRAPDSSGEDGLSLLERFGWGEADRNAFLGRFGPRSADLSHLYQFSRMHAAFGLLRKLKVSAVFLLDSLSNEPSQTSAEALRAALRARYADRDWIRVIQPINDASRSSRRDALVAHVLHGLRREPATSHIDSPEKLFEYLLIDVGMDACMKTSRVKQAISSVQLFTQRCLLNLEPRVASSSIDARQWAWMKRYRVWEANRKVFLFPENWLEPELRDNKSPFFKELENELLQGDITEDGAARALVGYLEKLDQVAKLEIAGMCLEENDFQKRGRIRQGTDVAHVIGCTTGSRRIWFYRKRDGVVWSPWEKVDLHIEEKPVLPVFWKGRLLLFWVSPIQEGAAQGSGSANQTMDLTNISAAGLKAAAGESKAEVRLALYWSEYTRGKWQPPRSSDINRPLSLGNFSPTGDDRFRRDLLRLRSAVEESGALMVEIGYPGRFGGSFRLYQTHGEPVQARDDAGRGPIQATIENAGMRRVFAGKGNLTLAYVHANRIPLPFSLELLGKTEAYQIVAPGHPLARVYEAPFFFQDREHVFFVRSEREIVMLNRFRGFGMQPAAFFSGRPMELIESGLADSLETGFAASGLVLDIAGERDAMAGLVRHEPQIQRALVTTGAFRYGDRLILPGGSIMWTEPANSKR